MMATQKFLKVRSSLLCAKHVNRMGNNIWLYLYMLDRADWDDGTLYGWKDQEAAEALGMSAHTVRHQRRRLEEEGYIVSTRRQHSLEIRVERWTNPKAQSGNPLPDRIESGNQSGNQSGNEIIHGVTDHHLYTDSRKQITDVEAAAVFTHFENNVQLLTPTVADDITEWLAEYPHDWIIDAIDEAVRNNVLKIKYIGKILVTWKAKGKGQRKQTGPAAVGPGLEFVK